MPNTTLRFLLLSLIVALLAGMLFTPGLPGDFVFDDIPNIVDNKRIHMNHPDADGLAKVLASPQISGFMRILPTLSFALDYWRGGGPDPATFKTTNIVLHALTALALAGFFRSLLLISGIATRRTDWLAPALALAWAAHPLQVSSVLYTVQRFQTMGTFFLVLGLWAYLVARQAQIQGRPGRTGMLGALLLWALAMACKEDSILLPAYALALELTVLRFAAADPRVAGLLRRTYLAAVLAGLAAYAFLVLPHYWHWDAYPGRDYSTPERLLTQARVLCLYMGQILLPLPQNMSFFYDWLQPSRGLLQPWTTLPAVATVLGLLAVAWRLRTRQPLFALGVLLFFAAHGIASNVPNLELAFEHRNHFALIGAVLAVGSLLAAASRSLQWRPVLQATAATLVLVALAGTTLARAHSWRSGLSLAQTNAANAPGSARAWVTLCMTHLELGGGPVPANPRLDQAIAACESGTAAAPHVLNNAALLIVLKTLRGDANPQDWHAFRARLASVRMGPENQMATVVLIGYVRQGVALDKDQLLETIDAYVARSRPAPFALAAIGYFVMNDLAEPDLAMPYFVQVIEDTSPFDPFWRHLSGELAEAGRSDLAGDIERLGLARRAAAGPAPN